MTGIGDNLPLPSFAGRAAVARRDITPPAGIRARNWGPAAWDESTGVHRPLTLTALALSSRGQDDGPQLLFAVDGTWWRRVADEWSVRGEILRRLCLNEDQLLFSLSHTHAGPVLSVDEAGMPGGEHIPGYLTRLTDAAVEAGAEALANLAIARLEWAHGTCTLASNRELDLDGRALVGFNPDSAADDALLVGRLSDDHGNMRAVLVNYACHPTTLAWENSLISPDYVGAMREVVEDRTGVLCLFLQGASGDLAPRHQYTGDVQVADQHGTSLGHSVLAALFSLPPPGMALELTDVVESGAPLARWSPQPATASAHLAALREEAELQLRPLASMEEIAEQWSDIDPRSRDERLRRARALRDGYIVGPTVQHPLWVWRWGDAVVVAHPGEAYSKLQTTLRKVFPELVVVVMNLTNGPGFVYLPSQEAYDRGAYQAWQTPLAPGSLERLEEHAIQLVRTLTERNT